MSENVFKIPKLLGSKNWDIWSLRMTSLLTEKGYDTVCSESTINSNSRLNEQERAERKSLANKAIAYIRLGLDDGPLLQTKNETDPCELWAKLRSLYETKGFSSEFLLIKQLMSTTLANSKGNLESYLQTIKRILNDLSARSIELPTNFIAAFILGNLTKDYDYIVAIITQTIRQSKLVDIDSICEQLIDESKRIRSTKTLELSDQPTSNTSNSPKDVEMSNSTNKDSGSKKNRTIKKCTYCSLRGHLEDRCYKKHPELRPNRVSSTSTGSSLSEEQAVVTSATNSDIALVSKSSTTDFILDSGATTHICHDKSLFNFLKPDKSTIKWGNNKDALLKAQGIGDISIRFSSTNKPACIKDVLYVPDLGLSLLSTSVLCSRKCSLKINSKAIELYGPDTKLLALGEYRNRVTVLSVYKPPSTTQTQTSKQILATSTSYNPWHYRLGHIGTKAIESLPNNTEGTEARDFNNYSSDFKDCEVCIRAKATSKNNKEVSEKPTNYLEKVTLDIGGPIKPATNRGFKYYLTLLDAAIGYLEVELLPSRDSSLLVEAIKTFTTRAEKQTSYELRRIHSDLEFKTKALEDYAREKGIILTYSAAYTPEQKGAGERINRTLFDKVRALLFTSNLARKYQGEALLSAVYLYNRTPHSSYSFRTPYELRYQKKPNLSSIKTFGSLAFKKEPKETTTKLEPKATAFYLIGYGSNQYKLLDPKTSKTAWARDVYIIENRFYRDTISTEDLIIEPNPTIEDNNDSNKDNSRSRTSNIDSSLLDNISRDDIIESSKGKSYKEFYNELLEHAALTTSLENEPTSIKEVLAHLDKDKYLEAIDVELSTLESNNTWTLVPRPKDKPVLKGRWVFKRKTKADGSLDKYKARWVVKGFMQQYGINYKETFAGTTKPVVLRLLLAIACFNKLVIYKWDIKQAFPTAPIDEEIYVEQPTNYSSNNLVCRLNKALYGLKQAARQWQLLLTSILSKLGFYNLVGDTSIYISGSRDIMLAVYVDDILVFAKDTPSIKELYNDLVRAKLDVVDLGEVKEYLGIEIYREEYSLQITQQGFINRLLKRYNKDNIKPKTTPYILGLKYEPYTEKALPADINRFQQEIGSLIYLTIYTRPDLTYAVNFIARFMSNPSPEHFKALDQIWGYLKETSNYAISIDLTSLKSLIQSANYKLNIKGYSDADWGGDPATRKSTSAYINILGLVSNSKDEYLVKWPISWHSKLQKTVALSSCEAEYMAYKEAIKESIFIRNIIRELPSKFKDRFECVRDIYTDSQSGIELAKNPLYHARTKHVDIRYNFIREKVSSKEIELLYYPTDSLLADGLTKAIPPNKWREFIDGIGLIRL